MTGPAGGATPRWREAAREFARSRVTPISSEIDRNDRVPPSLLHELSASGFMGLGLPEAFGGTGGGAAAVAAVLEEIAYGNGAVATMLSVHLAVAAAPVAQWGTPAQKERYLRPLAAGTMLGAFALTEPSVGSDAARLTTRYVREAGGYRLTGSKTFITDADLAGMVLTFATRDPALGRPGISAFLVPKGTVGFRVAAHLPKLGLHGSTTTELHFDAAALDAEAMLGPEGDGFRIATESLAGGRVGIAACALGVARAALDTMGDAIRADPDDWKRAAYARAFVEVESAAALVAAAATAKDAGAPYVPLASAAKLAASRAAVTVASRGIDVAGRGAGTEGSRAAQLLRDARVFPIVEGTTEIQELILGRELLGRPAPTTPSAR